MVLGRGIHYFPAGPLANIYGNLYICGFQGDEGLDPQPSIGSAHASTLYLRIFHSVLNHLTRLYKVRT